MNGLSLYWRYTKMNLQSQLAYKGSFMLMTIGHFVITVIEFIGIYALFSRFGTIRGWGIYEVAMFYGLINCAFAVAEAFGRGYDTFHVHVRTGSFDRYLLRPRPLSLQILGSEFQLMRIGRLLQGFIILTVGINNVDVLLRLEDYFLLLLAVVGGVFVFVGLLVLQATMSFWTVQTLEVMNAFTYGGVQMAQYPMDIYRHWFKRLFTVLLPIGAINYLPLTAILRDGSRVMAYMTPLIGLAFFGGSLLVFSMGTRYYCSTGS